MDKSRSSNERKLKILRAQARQLEACAQDGSGANAFFLEDQYNKLRKSLVSIDPEAEEHLPQIGHTGFLGAMVVDTEDLKIGVRDATKLMNAYLDASIAPTSSTSSVNSEIEVLIPEEVLQSLPKEIRRTMSGICYNYQGEFIDFCFWGMRKALIDAIRIRFKIDKEEEKLYDKNGNPYKLSKWIELAKQRKYLSNAIAKKLNDQVKVFGDAASHDYMVNLQKPEVLPIFTCLRIALARMYYEDKNVQNSR